MVKPWQLLQTPNNAAKAPKTWRNAETPEKAPKSGQSWKSTLLAWKKHQTSEEMLKKRQKHGRRLQKHQTSAVMRQKHQTPPKVQKCTNIDKTTPKKNVKKGTKVYQNHQTRAKPSKIVKMTKNGQICVYLSTANNKIIFKTLFHI